MTPAVSVIIPVYNSVDYLRETVQSVVEQTIGHSEIELIAVDDGSNDGSAEVLTELSARHRWISVITQENSGTAGGARNPAIDRAQGTYVFFLDSDDKLTPDALRRMVETAEAEASDVVLGKVAGLGGRRPPQSMFHKTVLDADLLRDHVFNTLGPWKLIRRSLIEELDLRFPDDQKVGEDQPFMATVYLNARKISVLADMDYYLLRRRDDGTNLTHSVLDSAAQMQTALRLAKTIETYTQHGTLRDFLLKRPFGWSMRRALDARWLRVPPPEQAKLAERFRAEAGHLCTDSVRRSLGADVRIKLGLLLAGNLEGLNAYIDHVRSTSDRRIAWDDGAFRLQLPEELARAVPKEDLVVAAPAMSCRLEGVTVEGAGASVWATIKTADLVGAPDEVLLRARKRGARGVRDFEKTSQEWSSDAGASSVSGVVHDLPRGVWDVYVVVRFGHQEKELRLGANRARTIEPEGVSNLHEEPSPDDAVIAYFTNGPSNLSLDVGAVLHKQVARARVLGLTLDENARCLMLVQTTRAPRLDDEYFASVKGTPQHGGRQLLPVVRLGERLLGVRLPVDREKVGARVTVTSVLGGARATLPVTGTEFWPARAAGYELIGTEGGGVLVGTKGSGIPVEGLKNRRQKSATRRLLRHLRKLVLSSRSASRAASTVKRLPLVGPVATRVVRTVRNWRR